jgi:membrane-associated PAP2 superfamily phosphatase/signal transduction histidine kinase
MRIRSPRGRAWWLAHLLVPCTLLAGCWLLIERSDLDRSALGPFFDASTRTFPLRHSPIFAGLFHTGGKVLVLAATILLALVAVASWRIRRLRAWRIPSAYLVICVGLTTAIVGGLKAVTHRYPPWSLDLFGGSVPDTPMFVPPPAPFTGGNGWPAGHAAAGFAWLSLYFVGRALGQRPARWWLAPGILLGALFGWTQHVRGAHFPSHNLVTMAIAWAVAVGVAWVFAATGRWDPAGPARPQAQPPAFLGIAAQAWIIGLIGALSGAALFAVDSAVDLLRHSPKSLHFWIECVEFAIIGPGLGSACLLFHQHLLAQRAAAIATEHAERERRMVTLGRMAAAVAHEVRNPLHNLRLLVDELRLDIPALRDHPLGSHIDGSLERIDGAVDLVYQLARPGAEDDAAGDLALALREAAAFHPAASIEVVVDGSRRHLVRCSKAALRIIVGNLLRNAVEAAHGGGVRAEVDSDASRGRLVVVNPGEFRPGAGVDGSAGQASLKDGGLGLGLAISRQLIANAVGSLDVRDAGGRVVAELILPTWKQGP